MVQYLQHIAASSTLMVDIFITMISFVMAHTIMTMLLGDGKYNYVPKRLRWNQARVQRIYRKARNRWKMSTMWLVIWGAMSTIGSSIKLSSVNVETYTFEQCSNDRPTICSLMGTTSNDTKRSKPRSHREIFDGDTFDMVIDSGCSYCMNHFVGTPEQTNVAVKGIGGQIIKATMKRHCEMVICQ